GMGQMVSSGTLYCGGRRILGSAAPDTQPEPPAGVARGHGRTRQAMVLSDRTIKELIQAGRLRIDPFDALAIQPSSVDLRLDRRFRIFRSTRYSHIDPRQEQADLTELVTVGDGETFVLQPGQFCLGNTWEEIALPDDVV